MWDVSGLGEQTENVSVKRWTWLEDGRSTAQIDHQPAPTHGCAFFQAHQRFKQDMARDSFELLVRVTTGLGTRIVGPALTKGPQLLVVVCPES